VQGTQSSQLYTCVSIHLFCHNMCELVCLGLMACMIIKGYMSQRNPLHHQFPFHLLLSHASLFFDLISSEFFWAVFLLLKVLMFLPSTHRSFFCINDTIDSCSFDRRKMSSKAQYMAMTAQSLYVDTCELDFFCKLPVL
jgi:hypothetical protein